MFRVILFFLFLFLPLSACYSQQQPEAGDTEKKDAYTWDFGRVEEGAVLKHTFTFKNDSERVINIKDVHTSCGCTASSVTKKSLSPGESTSIEVRFNTAGYSGPVQQYIYVHTDNLDSPVTRYIIKAKIKK